MLVTYNSTIGAIFYLYRYFNYFSKIVLVTHINALELKLLGL